MGVTRILCFCLACCLQAYGSDPEFYKFILKGEDLYLHLRKPVDQIFDVLKWGIVNKHNILIYNPKFSTVNYFGNNRATFSIENYSLLLRNLTVADSGLYEAVASGMKDNIVAEYNITVQEQVSPAVLTVMAVSSHPESCNLTATCGNGISNITDTFMCTNQTCKLKGGQSSEIMSQAVPFHLYWSNGSLFCNYSNQVSWRHITEESEPYCSSESSDSKIKYQIGILTSVIFAIVAIVLSIYIFCSRLRRVWIPDGRNDPASPTSQSSSEPFTTYSTVGPHSGPVDSATANGTQTTPSTLYATVLTQKSKK